MASSKGKTAARWVAAAELVLRLQDRLAAGRSVNGASHDAAIERLRREVKRASRDQRGSKRKER